MKQIALVLFVGILTGACSEGSERGTGTPAVAAAAAPVSEYTREARRRRAERAYVGEGRTAPRVGSEEGHRRQSAAAAPPPDKGAWRTSSREDPVTGRTRHSAVLMASNRTEGIVSQPVTSRLVVRCQDNKTEVYLDWETYLGGNSGDFRDNRQIVTLRIGDGDPFTVRANVSTDNEATFFPSPIPSILKPAANADTLAARTTPYNESPQTAVFNLTGMRAALSDLAAACNWSF